LWGLTYHRRVPGFTAGPAQPYQPKRTRLTGPISRSSKSFRSGGSMRTGSISLSTAISLALACAGLGGGAALAQSDSSGRSSLGQLEEITVTGTKREEAQQDVPIAISAVTADQLSRVPLNDVRALGQLAPGLVLSNPSGFNATGGGMRGTGTNIILVTQDAPVSFLMDEFVLSHVTSQFLTLFDTQQIEVYRGPQGTLFGKNTTGGVISITSKPPELGEYFTDLEFGIGQYENGANTSSVKAAINIPIGETLALRLAGIYDQSDGYYTDDKDTATFPDNVPLWGLFGIPPGTPLPPEVDVTAAGPGGPLGGRDVLAAKAKLLWQPNDWYQAYFILEGVRDRSDSPPGVNESIDTDLLTALGFPGIGLAGQSDVFSTLISHNAVIDMDRGHEVDNQGAYLTQTFRLGAGEIKSITGYREEVQRLPSTYTGEAFQTLFDSTRNTERYTFQQELRFASDFDGPFNFVGGGNYFKDAFNFRAFFSVGLTSLIPVVDPDTGGFLRPDGAVSLDTRSLYDYQMQYTEQDREEYALFWDGTYELTDRWRFTAGVRYSHDEKDFIRAVDGGGQCNQFSEARDIVMVDGNCIDTRSQFISRANILPREWDGRSVPLPPENFGVFVDTTDSWEETTWRTVLDFKPLEDQLLYLSYATGFLSGGFSETCATVSRCPYDPETNTNIELGWKADLLDSTLRLNIAAFFTEYEDLQRAVVATYVSSDGTNQQETVTVNTGSSEAKGVDLEALWVPTENSRINAFVNYLDHEYTSGELPNLRADTPNAPPVPLEQFDVPYSPEWKAGVTVEYDWLLTEDHWLTLGGAVNYQSEAETDVFNGANTLMEERTLLDLFLTWNGRNGDWSVTLYGSNLTDETYRVAALPVAGLWNFTNYGAPRQYGLTVRAHFGD
jgi:iron complex outermembrane receptor protein